MRATLFLALASLAPAAVLAQLSGRVGPKVDFRTKAKHKTCDITDYGAKADGKTDVGPAILKAWQACKNGGLVYIPPGTFALKQDLVLKGGKSSAVQLDGIIERRYAGSYQMILIRDCDDFEFFSGNSKGALQGYGYEYLRKGNYGVRFMRVQNVRDFSFHGFAAIDSPSYYFVFDTVENGEIYNIIARGVAELGMTDAFDIWGKNVWVHDIEVTNGDECVTVKSPAENFLIEKIYCNLSGGTAIGSVNRGTDVKNIHYRDLYMNQADACYLKTNGGDGTVKNILWEDVIVHDGPYPLAVNAKWGPDRGSSGVQISNLTFRNWYGEAIDRKRPVIRLDCDPRVPCYDIKLENINLWASNAGDKGVTHSCKNAHGSGVACLGSANGKSKAGGKFENQATLAKKPNHAAPRMPNDLKKPLNSNAPFTIPPVPTTFYPGATPVSKLLKLKGPGGLGGNARAAVATEVPEVPELAETPGLGSGLHVAAPTVTCGRGKK